MYGLQMPFKRLQHIGNRHMSSQILSRLTLAIDTPLSSPMRSTSILIPAVRGKYLLTSSTDGKTGTTPATATATAIPTATRATTIYMPGSSSWSTKMRRQLVMRV